jgi:hypothetical protein
MTGLIPVTAAALFYLIPIVIGAGAVSAKRMFRKSAGGDAGGAGHRSFLYNPLLNLFLYFIYGSVIIYIAAFISALLSRMIAGADFIQLFAFVSYALAVTGLALYVLGMILKKNPVYGQNDGIKTAIVVLTGVFLATLVYLIWRVDAPFNTTLNWDIYHHQLISNLIEESHFHLFASRISDTFQFDGYSTIFHTMIALPQVLMKPEVLEFWWYIEYLHLFTTIIASFLVGYLFTKSTKVGIISAVLGAFIFEVHGAYTSLFLIPQNLAATLSAVYLAYLSAVMQEDERAVDPSLFVFVPFILLMHTIIGSVAVFIALCITAYHWLKKRYEEQKLQKALLTLAFIGLIITPVVMGFIDFNSINRGEAQYYNFTYAQKVSTMKDIYGYTLAIFLPLGLISAWSLRKRQTLLLAVIAIVLLIPVISPIPYALKIYALGRYFVHALMAIGIAALWNKIDTRFFTIGVVVLSVVLTNVFILNVVKFKQVPNYAEISTHISPYEVEAAKFLRDSYYGTNTLLVSDPATMHLLEGLSGVNTPGGAYTDIRTREILTKIYYSRDSRTMAPEIKGIRDGVKVKEPAQHLLAVSGRFKKWQETDDERRYGIHWNVWTPRDLSMTDLDSYEFVDFIRREAGFKEVFNNPGIVIFEVR